MPEPFDSILYTRAPVIDVPSGYALGVALLTALPPELDAGSLARGGARRLRSSLEVLRAAWATREKLGGSIDRRPFDAAADAAWRSLLARLHAAAMLGGTPELDAIAKEARELLDVVFTGGLAFTQLPYPSQWAHAERLLSSLEGDIARRIDRIAGEPYLAYVRQTHAAYGEALRITATASEAELAGGVREPLRGVQVAIQEYVFGLLATFPPSRPENVPVLRRALAPLDAHRARQRRAQSGTTPGEPAPIDPALPPVIEPAGPPPTDPLPPVD